MPSKAWSCIKKLSFPVIKILGIDQFKHSDSQFARYLKVGNSVILLMKGTIHNGQTMELMSAELFSFKNTALMSLLCGPDPFHESLSEVKKLEY